MHFSARSRNRFLRSVSTPLDRCKLPAFGVWDVVELLTLIIGVLIAMRRLVL